MQNFSIKGYAVNILGQEAKSRYVGNPLKCNRLKMQKSFLASGLYKSRQQATFVDTRIKSFGSGRLIKKKRKKYTYF